MTMLCREFIEAGFRIFPLWRFGPGGCECGNVDCAALGKHPRASNWQHTPQWDDEQIDTMEEFGHLDTGYGVLCKGLLVIDVDARNGGVDSFERLCADIPEIRGADFIVGTGSGGGSRHVYYLLSEAIPLLSHHADYPGIDFKSSGFVVGPGSKHHSGGVYQALAGSPYDIGPPPADLLAMLRKPERHRTEYNGATLDVSHADIADMLAHVANDDCHYDDWVKIGMAVHQATGGTGYELWREWSARSSKHDESMMEKRWHSFGKSANPVTIGTLIYHAEQGGWVMPVTFHDAPEFDMPEPVAKEAKGDLPFDISGVDLTSPPGFVGEVARWVESQSRRPRLHLSVATALTAIGNVGGLRYMDARDGATSNLFAFCVAGSGTGKEAMNQAIAKIHRVAGLAPATHGSIKSEQEITRNLVRHQAALYVIDEVGHLLGKIANAQKRGGAAYLEATIGVLMSAYSKANSFMLLTGDVKEAVKAELLKEISQITRKLDDGPAAGGSNAYLERRLASLQHQLDSIDNGLERPFVSMVGYTTPVMFDTLVDFEGATNGFFGRSVVFNERDTAPPTKANFRAPPMPESMAATIRAISTGGEYDTTENGRVEYLGDRAEIPTDAKADAMLEAARVWYDKQAAIHRDGTGLEALYLRAYELLSKVSLILAIPERLRTAEHVRWAFALVRRDVEEKMRLVTANDRDKDAPVVAMRARIANTCSGGEGVTAGVLYNKLRPRKKDDIDKVVAGMIAAGELERIEVANAGNGKPTVRYRYIEGG